MKVLETDIVGSRIELVERWDLGTVSPGRAGNLRFAEDRIDRTVRSGCRTWELEEPGIHLVAGKANVTAAGRTERGFAGCSRVDRTMEREEHRSGSLGGEHRIGLVEGTGRMGRSCLWLIGICWVVELENVRKFKG